MGYFINGYDIKWDPLYIHRDLFTKLFIITGLFIYPSVLHLYGNAGATYIFRNCFMHTAHDVFNFLTIYLKRANFTCLQGCLITGFLIFLIVSLYRVRSPQNAKFLITNIMQLKGPVEKGDKSVFNKFGLRAPFFCRL